jgi:heme A synthase
MRQFLVRVFLDPPRHRPVGLVGYIVAVIMGIACLTVPPRTIENEHGTALTFVWGLIMLIGGLGGCLTVYSRWWWAERASILLLMTGLMIYLTQVVWLIITAEGNRVPQLCSLIFAELFFLSRILNIRGWDYRPPILDDRG